MKIIIIGAGISGLAAYLELKKHLPVPSGLESSSSGQHLYTIYEAYDSSIDTVYEQRTFDESNYSATLVVGGGLAIAPNGLSVLKRLDEELLRDMVRAGCMIDTFEMRTRGGSLLVSMQSDRRSPGNQKDGSNSRSMKTLACLRQEIWRSLRTRVPDEVILKKKVSEVISVTDLDGKTKHIVHFEDGSPSAEADLVIGADGVKSTARKALFPDQKDAYPPQYE
jgi:2-polyprenyl-6-methoxyphenol hydroxylase-like FAD-dependent oxidoreductase